MPYQVCEIILKTILDVKKPVLKTKHLTKYQARNKLITICASICIISKIDYLEYSYTILENIIGFTDLMDWFWWLKVEYIEGLIGK